MTPARHRQHWITITDPAVVASSGTYDCRRCRVRLTSRADVWAYLAAGGE